MRKLLLALAQPATHRAWSQAFPNLAESAKLKARMSVRGMLEHVNMGMLAEGKTWNTVLLAGSSERKRTHKRPTDMS